MKSTKKGKELYAELIRPMAWLAKKHRKMGIKKMSEIRAERIKTIEELIKRSKNPPKIVRIE